MSIVSRFYPPLMAALLIAVPATPARAEAEISVPARNETDIDVIRYAADGDYLLVWIAPDYGFREPHRSLARGLAAQGVEVWQSDIAESLFLPNGSETLRGLDGGYVADLVEQAHLATGKQIALAGDAYAALPALTGAREWRRRGQDRDYLLGAILFTPYTYASIPPLGSAPDYMPIVDASNIPILIYQAQNSPSRHQFEALVERLGRHGNPVYRQPLGDIMSLFYEQPVTAAMQRHMDEIPAQLKKMLPLLASHGVPAETRPMRPAAGAGSGIDSYLREYRGQARPGNIRLADIDGNVYTRGDFSGQVTLVNFWTTWCPPCVEEIPSLNRLQREMSGRPFELISVNYAESRDTVAEFMRRVEVDFPVLLDLDGRHAKEWKVISYPSTFVIDSSGVIRYGVNAAIAWDDPALLRKLETLME